jgi:tetratricopeptide (TPR) repeat protein
MPICWRRSSPLSATSRPEPEMTEPNGPLLARAMELHRAGDLGAAARLYRDVLRSEPGNFDAANLVGAVLLRQDNAEEALAMIERALALDPQSFEGRLNQGYALCALDRLDEAVDGFRHAIELRPDFAEAHSALAFVLATLERNEEAAAAWRQAIALAPEGAELHHNLGLALIALGRNEEAAAAWRQAIALDPGFAEAHDGLGVALARMGRLDEAVASHRRAVELDPEPAAPHLNLGAALSKLGRHQEAAECYRRAIEIASDHAEAHNNLGNALRELDRAEDAVTCYRRAIDIAPDYADPYTNLGTLQIKSRQYEEAVVSLRRALAINPEIADAHNGLAYALGEQRQLAEAIAHFEKALRIKPDYAEAHNNLGIALRMIGRAEDGQRAIETAIRLEPTRVEFYASLAASAKRFAEGDPHLAAMEELARNIASASSEDQMQLHFALGKALRDVGRHEGSFAHLLAGNALKRQETAYDEAPTLGVFDRIRQIFTTDLMRQKAGLGHPSAVPIFIIGMPRSGTTLVEQILASHPQVFGAGELSDLPETVAQIVTPDTASTGFPEGVPALSATQLHQLGERYLERVGALAPAALRITDKLPANYYLAGLIHLALPNARIIHTRRNPVDTCLSCFSILFGAPQPHTYDLGELGRYYRAYAALMEHWRRVLPPGIMLEVQYEEVVADFERQARRIVTHCGLVWDNACLAFHKNRRPVWTASVNQVRQPIYDSAVGRWRPYAKMLGPLLSELGIEPTTV